MRLSLVQGSLCIVELTYFMCSSLLQKKRKKKCSSLTYNNYQYGQRELSAFPGCFYGHSFIKIQFWWQHSHLLFWIFRVLYILICISVDVSSMHFSNFSWLLFYSMTSFLVGLGWEYYIGKVTQWSYLEHSNYIYSYAMW